MVSITPNPLEKGAYGLLMMLLPLLVGDSSLFAMPGTRGVPLLLTSQSSWSGSISCSGDLSIEPKGDVFKLSLPVEYDTCREWFEWQYVTPFSKEEAKAKYDTLRMYIEHCAATDDKAWQVFGDITSALKLSSNDTMRWELYREWLISVLYLNPQDKYYCVCLGQIARTYQYGKYHPAIASLAIHNFARQEGRCWDSLSQVNYTEDSIWAEEEGLDPTNLPPLDSLGLGFLLKSDVANSDPLSRLYLASFGASPNPFRNELSLNFTLNRTSYVSVQLFDLLGRMVWESKGRTFNEGAHELLVDARFLPHGTLYARISTGFGEVKTVKVVKE